MKTRKSLLAALGIAGAITGGLALATPAQATGCSSGYGGWGGGGFCDTDYWRDGSYMHCVNVDRAGLRRRHLQPGLPMARSGQHGPTAVGRHGPEDTLLMTKKSLAVGAVVASATIVFAPAGLAAAQPDDGSTITTVIEEPEAPSYDEAPSYETEAPSYDEEPSYDEGPSL